jgi:hypothetical protein
VSQTITLSTIQSRVISICGLPATLTTDTTVTLAEMLDYLKMACTLLGGAVKKRSSEFYFTTSSNLSTVANTATVAIPSGFSDLYYLKWLKSSSEEIDLYRATPEDFKAYPNTWNRSECPKIYYRLVGDNIEFFPTPDAVYTVKAYYSTGLYPTDLSSTFNGRDGWDQWIALQAALMVRTRQQKDAADIRMLLYGSDGISGGVNGALLDQLKRDKYGVRQVRDVRGSIFRSERDPWPDNS